MRVLNTDEGSSSYPGGAGKGWGGEKESSKCAMDSTDKVKVIQPVRKPCQAITPTLTKQPESSTASLILGSLVHSAILILGSLVHCFSHSRQSRPQRHSSLDNYFSISPDPAGAS